MSAAAAHSHHDHLAAEHERFHHGVNLAMLMAFVTGIELVIIFVPLAPMIIFWAVVILSLVKFVGVMLWFMHLIYDHKLLLLVFCAGLVVAGGTVTALLFLFHPDDVIPVETVSVPLPTAAGEAVVA